MTAVTTQSNKIVSKEPKDNEALLEPSYRKNPNKLFDQHNRSHCGDKIYFFSVLGAWRW